MRIITQCILLSMYYYEVAPNQIVRKQSNAFTYSSNTQLVVGQLVIVEVGKKSLIGVVTARHTAPPHTTRSSC